MVCDSFPFVHFCYIVLFERKPTVTPRLAIQMRTFKQGDYILAWHFPEFAASITSIFGAQLPSHNNGGTEDCKDSSLTFHYTTQIRLDPLTTSSRKT